MTIDNIKSLMDHPDVARIDVGGDDAPQIEGSGVNGAEKSEVYQTRLFWDLSYSEGSFNGNYDGDNGADLDLRFAVMDVEQFRSTHVAFTESSGGVSRIDSCWDCTDEISCEEVDPCWSSPEGAHGTWVLSSFFGDYRDGQDPAVTTVAAREELSAPGGEARAYLYEEKNSANSLNVVYDHVVTMSPFPRVFVTADGAASSDCSGTSQRAKDVDDLYQAGVAYMISAGNTGSLGSTSNCNISSPGDAIGAFVVAGYESSDPSDTLCDLRSADISPDSCWGGSITDFNEGRFRSIVGVAGAYSGGPVALYTGDTATAVAFSGTSHATPSVASVAVDVIDMFKNYRGTDFIDDPGVLYAWLLNMGDRTKQGGGKMVKKFDHRLGAGKINARFIGNPGMDAPWLMSHTELCVGDSEVQTIAIGSMAADIDSLRAVAWWYDRRLEDQSTIDDIDLYLKQTNGTLIESSVDAYDNKERVYAEDVGGLSIKLEVAGYRVTSDGEGCGTNKMRVYVTLLLEDDDRDDGDGPDFDPVTCEGVQTL